MCLSTYSFSQNQHIVAVDVSYKTLDYCMESAPKVKKMSNTVSTITTWIKQLPQNSLVVFEPTGNYSDKLQRSLEAFKQPYSLVGTQQSRAFARAIGKHNKSDIEDARTLLRLGKSLNLQPSKVPSKKMLDRKQLLSSLNALQKQQQQLNNQIHALEQCLDVVPLAASALRNTLEVLEQQIKQLQTELRTYTNEEEAKVRELMMSVPGIGPKSADLLIQLTDCLKNFDTDKQLVKFVGTAPTTFQSGTSVHRPGRVSKKGNAQLRRTLYMAARSAKRHNPDCKALYTRLREKGKPHKLAMVAVINKMLRQVFTIVKTQTPFDKDYELKKQENKEKNNLSTK